MGGEVRLEAKRASERAFVKRHAGRKLSKCRLGLIGGLDWWFGGVRDMFRGGPGPQKESSLAVSFHGCWGT